MNYTHKQAAEGRWFKFSIFEQMANIGSEVERTIIWREKNKDYSEKAFFRALELIDLTLADKKNKTRGRLKELARVREMLCDYFMGDNQWSSTDDLWRKYFYPFNWAARSNH
ncbi:MAG: hypothetical protein WCW77_00745 [Patescibacteria group bacterium]|jgi:hypothetical protein